MTPNCYITKVGWLESKRLRTTAEGARVVDNNFFLAELTYLLTERIALAVVVVLKTTANICHCFHLILFIVFLVHTFAYLDLGTCQIIYIKGITTLKHFWRSLE